MSCAHGAARTGGGTEAAPPAHGLVDGNIAPFDDNGFKGAEALADQASGTESGIDVADHRFQEQLFSGRQSFHDSAGRGLPLGHGSGDILGSLGASRHENPFADSANRIQPGIGFLKKAVFPPDSDQGSQPFPRSPRRPPWPWPKPPCQRRFGATPLPYPYG